MSTNTYGRGAARCAPTITLLCFWFVAMAHAQDAVPPILQFENFAASDNVLLVDELPLFTHGENENLLYFREGGDWLTAEFPDVSRYDLLQPILYNYQQPDGSYLLFRASIFRSGLTWQHMPVEFLWRFDPLVEPQNNVDW